MKVDYVAYNIVNNNNKVSYCNGGKQRGDDNHPQGKVRNVPNS